MMNGLAYGGAGVLASSLDMRIGCEDSKFRFLAAAYGRINSTWTLPNQVGWPIAKELLFSARIVEAEEAYRIGLLNHLVPRDQLRAKTMELARTIAGNNRAAVVGIKQLMLKQMSQNLEEQYEAERHFTTHVVRGAKAEEAFPEFIARHGRKLGLTAAGDRHRQSSRADRRNQPASSFRWHVRGAAGILRQLHSATGAPGVLQPPPGSLAADRLLPRPGPATGWYSSTQALDLTCSNYRTACTWWAVSSRQACGLLT